MNESRDVRDEASRSAVPPGPGAGALLLVAALMSGVVPAEVGAGEARVLKEATLAPAGSSWHRILKEGARDWERLSDARLKVRIFPAGVAGDDPEMVSRMREGRLDIAVLSAVGLGSIDPGVYALGVPMAYASPEEADYVLEQMRPGLEARFAAEGFVVLCFFESGWVRFFTAEPAATPERLRSLPLLVRAGEEAREVWRSAGFQTLSLRAGEVLPALESGAVGAIGLPPQVAVLSQSYLHVPHMTAIAWQQVVSGIVIRRSLWEELPAELRGELLRSARDLGQRLEAELRQGEERDVAAMRQRGLDVVPVDDAARREWRRTAETMYPRIRGGIVPADAFDEAMRYREAFRSRER